MFIFHGTEKCSKYKYKLNSKKDSWIIKFQAHKDAVSSLRFTSDRKTMISSGHWTDPTMKIWKEFWKL